MRPYRRVSTSKIPSDPMEMEIFRRITELEKKVDELLKKVSMLENSLLLLRAKGVWYEERDTA